METQKAYHRIQFPDGTLLSGPFIVTFSENGSYAGHHILTAEEAVTEWVGGTFIVHSS